MQKSMTKSSEIPHLYLMDEFDITSIVKIYLIYNIFFIKGLIREELKKYLGVTITFFSLFVKAFSLALLKYPIMNSLYDPVKLNIKKIIQLFYDYKNRISLLNIELIKVIIYHWRLIHHKD